MKTTVKMTDDLTPADLTYFRDYINNQNPGIKAVANAILLAGENAALFLAREIVAAADAGETERLNTFVRVMCSCTAIVSSLPPQYASLLAKAGNN
jgi:hypothetical protein